VVPAIEGAPSDLKLPRMMAQEVPDILSTGLKDELVG
jgi:hypothetical protein